MSVLLKLPVRETFYFKQIFSSLLLNRNIHHYRNTVPWNNILELSEHLINSVIYNDDGLLVLNKPYGITFSRDGSSKESEEGKPSPEDIAFKRKTKHYQRKIIKQPYKTSGVVSDSLNLVDCLPYLKEHFRFNKLHISRVPGKYTSGVALLTTSKELVEKINKCRAHLPTGKDKYLMVVIGVPKHFEGTIKLGFKLDENKQKGKRTVLLREWSRNAYGRGEVRIGTFHYETLATGYDNLTSLVQVGVDLRKYNAYRLFAADYLLSPVLGDNLYGSRVQTVMGVPMSINHFSDTTDTPQKLSKVIYDLLQLSASEASLIPVHVHHAGMVIPRFFPGGKELYLEASPPPHFFWTCERLGLTNEQQTSIAAT